MDSLQQRLEQLKRQIAENDRQKQGGIVSSCVGIGSMMGAGGGPTGAVAGAVAGAVVGAAIVGAKEMMR